MLTRTSPTEAVCCSSRTQAHEPNLITRDHLHIMRGQAMERHRAGKSCRQQYRDGVFAIHGEAAAAFPPNVFIHGQGEGSGIERRGWFL